MEFDLGTCRSCGFRGDAVATAEIPAWRADLSRRLLELKAKRAEAGPEADESSASGPLPFPEAARSSRKATGPPGPGSVTPLRPRAVTDPEGGSEPVSLLPDRSPEPASEVHAPKKASGAAAIDQIIDRIVVRHTGQTVQPSEVAPVPADRGGSPAAAPDPFLLLSRTLSGLVDVSIVFLLGAGFMLAAHEVSGIAVFDWRSQVQFALLLAMLHFVYSMFFLRTASQTIGMMITDLRVVARPARRPATRQLLLRCALFLPSMLILGIGLIRAFFDRESRCLHDTLSGTDVERI